MQKKLLAVAVLSAFSGVAAAQSANVTLYGNIVQHVEWAGTSGGDGTAANAAGAGTGSSFRSTAASMTANRVATTATGVNAAFLSNAGVADQTGRFRFNPAGSHFGLRGNEDLGNGLSAWFQIELSANFGSNPGFGATSEGRAPTMRNTGVGLRSTTWGTVLFGVWDTPFNVAVNSTMNANTRIGGASTGHHANLLGGNVLAQGAVSGQATQAWCAAAGAALNTAGQCANFGMNFDRRERSSIQWWSPNWNGFEVRGAYNVTQDTGGVTVNNQAGNRNALKQSIWDLTVAYTNGPLSVGYAYERQNDTLAAAARTFGGAGMAGGEVNAATGLSGAWVMGSTSTAALNGSHMSGSKGTGHRFGGKYAFSNGIGVGAMWESLKWDMSYGVDAGAAATTTLNSQLLTGLKKTAFRLQANYTTGSHFIAMDYVRANATSGSIGQALTGAVVNSFDGSASGARAWQLNYNYALSKRTSIGAFYNTIRNETNAFYSGIVFAGVATPAGATANYTGMQLRHAF